MIRTMIDAGGRVEWVVPVPDQSDFAAKALVDFVYGLGVETVTVTFRTGTRHVYTAGGA